MRTTLYITICLLLIGNISLGQYANVIRTEINTAEVPEEVIVAQRLQFPEGFVTGWKFHTKQKSIQDDTSYYVAEFKKDGRMGNHAYYSEDGRLLAYVLQLNPKNLPGAMQENAANNLSRSYIKSAELIDLEKPKRMIYRLRLNSEGLLKYIYYDMNGNQLDKMLLPSEIFVFI